MYLATRVGREHCGTAYRRVASIALLEMRLMVLVRSDVRVAEVIKHRKATGVGNVIGNGGADAVGGAVGVFRASVAALEELEKKYFIFT